MWNETTIQFDYQVILIDKQTTIEKKMIEDLHDKKSILYF